MCPLSETLQLFTPFFPAPVQAPHVGMGSNLHGEIRVTESVCDYIGTEPGVEVRSIWCFSSSLAIRFVFGIKEVVLKWSLFALSMFQKQIYGGTC